MTSFSLYRRWIWYHIKVYPNFSFMSKLDSIAAKRRKYSQNTPFSLLFYLFKKKNKKRLTNNQKHNTLKTTFTSMSCHIRILF
jgi:hypothetical protein